MDPLSSLTPMQISNRLIKSRVDFYKLIESYAEEFSKDILIPFCRKYDLSYAAGNGTCIFVFEKDQTKVELSRPSLNWYDFDCHTGRYLYDDPMYWLIKKKGGQFKEQLEYIMKTLHLEVSRDDYFGFYCSINY